MNWLTSNVIEDKTLMAIWSVEAVQDYILLHVFGCTAYFSVKETS